MVDWSAANAPNRGKDSIWLGLTVRGRHGLRLTHLENPATRANATERIIQLAAINLHRGRRILIGFDFPFGFPAGTARALGKRGLPWRNLWQELDDRLVDHDDNRNNRFDVAEGLNAALTGEPFPFGVYHAKRFVLFGAPKSPAAWRRRSGRATIMRHSHPIDATGLETGWGRLGRQSGNHWHTPGLADTPRPTDRL